MGDKEETVGRGNDWEVVSLTASAYAAAPGPKPVDLKDDEKEVTLTPETSHPLYMSRHFVFPPTEHEKNIPSEASEKMEQETGKEDGDLNLKGFNEFENIFMASLHDERAIGGSHDPIHEPPADPVISPCVDLNPAKDEKHQVANANVPPWWKRSAASLISQAKQTNTVWSIFIAAAVMGIVILGQHWQQERWQILQLKWESTIGNEKAGRLIGPISRLKQAFVGGQRRDSFIRSSSQNDS